ncbi:MAG TPA: helix-hairpin-helix domain-containing protein [Candidatus Nanopelagicaceae bacterium]|nr:helix-hairpin-helix domain-containing protein [Candidatus Nanopelagicaceae bacterium]
MHSIMQIANGIGILNAERMKKKGIDSVEKLASSTVEDLIKIDGIGVNNAKMFVEIAKKHLKSIGTRERIQNIIKKNKPPAISSNETKACDLMIFGTNRHKVSLETIKKLASSNEEDLSRLKGIEISNAKRYIDIANNYLESMRKEERSEDIVEIVTLKQKEEIKLPNELAITPKLNKVSIPGKLKVKEYPQKLAVKTQHPEREKRYQKKQDIDAKSTMRPSYGIDLKTGKKKITSSSPSILKTFFPLETMQNIRFLHYKIKSLEEELWKNKGFSSSELNYILDYIKILNINYKTQSQIKILKELEISTTFYDPIDKKEIVIWDLIFECSRVLWILAQAYSFLSKQYEAENLMENAIVAMVECSKMYKTAAYFSAACTRQEDKGFTLSVENLELNSEESRILAQSLATTSEENKRNYSMAANLSAGLSALTKRLAFVKRNNKITENQFKAQYQYDIGRACHLKAKSLLKFSHEEKNEEKIERLQKKATYYYHKAEDLWENMLTETELLNPVEKDCVKNNLSIVNEYIIENDAELIDDFEALEIQDPEPLIIVPENLAPFIPRTTDYLTKYKQADINFDAYLRYKNLMSDVLVNFDKIEELKNSKAGVGRTIKQLKLLYENNDIDINSFTELFEKYSIKLETIEHAIQNIQAPENKKEQNKLKSPLIESTVR